MPDKPLIVVSNVKAYVKEKIGARCSDRCADALHILAKQALDQALLHMELDKDRTTLLERDFEGLFVAIGSES